MTRGKKVFLWVAFLIGIPLLWYLASPLIINRRVHEEFPVKMPTPEEVSQMTPEEKSKREPKVAAQLAQMPKTKKKEEMPDLPSPQLVAEGMFRDVDAIHRGSGKAKLYRLTDGSGLLRSEEIDIANGPNLYVYLVKHPDPQSAKDVTPDFVNLGRLKGNQGSQNYPIPSEVKVEDYGSAVIYCQLFGVLFSPASFQK